MSMRRRIAAVEQSMHVRSDVPVSVFWDGRDDDRCRERVEDARRRGSPLNIIRFTLFEVADTVEEAEAIVSQHRADGGRMAVTVYSRAAPGVEVLAEWDPGLPEWLRDEEL